MNDIPVCPLPEAIKVGDIIHFRDGQKKAITRINAETVLIHMVEGVRPGFIGISGEYPFSYIRGWDCIAVERDGVIIAGHGKKQKAVKKKTAKPKVDKDASFMLAHLAVCSDGDTNHIAIRTDLSEAEYNRRIRRIAKRLQDQIK